MTYDKPKVIIDLEEYKELIANKNKEINLFHLVMAHIVEFFYEKEPNVSINEINQYLREKANIELVRTAGGFIKVVKVL